MIRVSGDSAIDRPPRRGKKGGQKIAGCCATRCRRLPDRRTRNRSRSWTQDPSVLRFYTGNRLVLLVRCHSTRAYKNNLRRIVMFGLDALTVVLQFFAPVASNRVRKNSEFVAEVLGGGHHALGRLFHPVGQFSRSRNLPSDLSKDARTDDNRSDALGNI